MNRERILIALLVLGLTGCATGEQALEKMTPEERAFAEKVLMNPTREMTEEDLTRFMGPVYRGRGGLRPVWLGPGSIIWEHNVSNE